MKLELLESSRAAVVVRSKTLLGALDHDVRFEARPQASTIEGIEARGAIDVAVEARLRGDALEPIDTHGVTALDRGKMMENLRGKEVLDTARWPEIVLRGRYRGDLEKGTLEGEIELRGAPRRVRFDVFVEPDGERRWRARGTWQGTLTDLGIKPFKALLGAVKLADSARLEIDARFSEL